MDDGAEWEIMPHKTIEKIKDEIDGLKLKAASKDTISNESLRKSIDNLTHSVNDLMSLFKEAAEELKLEEESREKVSDQFGPLLNRIDNLESENKKIAQGILAVADLIEKDMKSKPAPGKPKQKETVKRTYSEQLVPKNKMPKFKVPKQHQATPQKPNTSFTTEEKHARAGDNVRHSMDSFGSPERHQPGSQQPLPPLDRPMPSFGEQKEPMMPPARNMPQPPSPQPRAAPSMPPYPQTSQGQPMTPPPSMPAPPGPGAPPGMPPPGGVPPPPAKKEGGFLGKIFKK